MIDRADATLDWLARDSGMVPAYPYRDFDGTPWPGCEQQEMTDDPVELAVIAGIAATILHSGIPEPFVRAGELIRTSWGCVIGGERQTLEAVVTIVFVGLYRDLRSMWYRPMLRYHGKSSNYSGLILNDIERQDGEKWEQPTGGNWAPFRFRLEWVSPLHGGIEKARN